ncbi:hypothetical protein D0Y65_043124 [Glycine soja]|uniref:Uncharacterized protein n=1 Tax=Glycine soja TaxID=3848 RepID=A0A445GG69_GLYSO|nr:hypothetical protein D0Y65_043124 [Glycine soja]
MQQVKISLFQVCSSGKEGSKDDVVMVDLVEAKRLAAKQMKKIKAKEKFMVKAILCLNLNHIVGVIVFYYRIMQEV